MATPIIIQQEVCHTCMGTEKMTNAAHEKIDKSFQNQAFVNDFLWEHKYIIQCHIA